jgi:hypothetical protein
MDLYTPAVLNRVIDDLRDDPTVGTFLINRYFGETAQSTEEAVYFDVLTGKPRLAPFVSPLVEGQIVQGLGYTTKSLTPAYIKDKRVMEDGKTIRRRAGQPIAAALDPMARRLQNIETESADQIKMVNRRMEWMAASALLTGTITVTGEKYPTTVVNYGRDSSLTVTLAGTARWNDSAPTPLDDLETWSGLIRTASGATAGDVIMSQGAWSTFRKNADVKALLSADKVSEATNIDLGPTAARYGATYKGTVGSFNLFIYSDSYVADDGSTKLYIPDGYVLVVSEQIEGVRHFGGIKDEQAGFQPLDYFQKSWTQPDPAVRFLMLQSAPLVVPYRINACLAAKVY